MSAFAVDLEAERTRRKAKGDGDRRAFDAFRAELAPEGLGFYGLDAGICPKCHGIARWGSNGPRCEGEGAGKACGDIGPALLDWLIVKGRPSERLQLLDYQELQTLPDQTWVIEGVIPAGLSVAYGASGAFKSFVVLDWALCVATGTPWFGHPVKAAYVVYVAAEGRGGLKDRARAWWLAHDKPDMSRMRWLPEVVDLRSRTAIEDGRQALASLPEWPGLVVVDTLARSMPGGDENAVKDLGEFLTGTDALRGDGSAVVVHHTGKDGDSERGSTALRGAADLMVKVKRDGRSLRLDLICDKLRDAEEWRPHAVRLAPKAGSLVPEPVTTTEAGLEERVKAFVQKHSPVSKRSVREGVTGGNTAIDEALDRLQRAGSIVLFDTGYIPCPEARGTPGHTGAHPPLRGLVVACPGRGGMCPKGTPGRGTPRPVPETPCPKHRAPPPRTPAARAPGRQVHHGPTDPCARSARGQCPTRGARRESLARPPRYRLEAALPRHAL